VRIVSDVLLPAGIASGEAVSAPAMALGLAPSAIASAEAFGAATTTIAIVASAIATGEAFGAAELARGVRPSAIASAEAFGDTELYFYVGNAGAIASAEAVGDPVVLEASSQLVEPTGIASSEAFGTPALTVRRPKRQVTTGGVETLRDHLRDRPPDFLVALAQQGRLYQESKGRYARRATAHDNVAGIMRKQRAALDHERIALEARITQAIHEMQIEQQRGHGARGNPIGPIVAGAGALALLWALFG
jgi:hypothetical protein